MAASAALLDLIDGQGGVLSFERFMAAALYDPRRGYYTTRVREVGPRGDFSTAATLTPALGLAVAAWVRAQVEELGLSDVIEVGAGTGALARVVLDGVPGLRLHVVEASPILEATQRERLAGDGARWHASMAAAVRACGGQAVVYSNELVDAFPAMIVQYDGERWQELVLHREGSAVVEALAPVSARFLSARLAITERRWPQGQRVEVHISYREWLAEWAPLLSRGSVLTIDYGDEVDALYHRRPQGTVRGYLGHLPRQGAELYEGLGQQDITADVCFTDLRRWGRDLGWDTVDSRTQAEFVLSHVAVDPQDAATRFVLHPQGMGQAVKVLWQRVGG